MSKPRKPIARRMGVLLPGLPLCLLMASAAGGFGQGARRATTPVSPAPVRPQTGGTSTGTSGTTTGTNGTTGQSGTSTGQGGAAGAGGVTTPASPMGTQTTDTPSAATPAAQKEDSAPPPPMTVQPSATVNSENYIIGAEDQLQVTVWKEPTLSGVVPVRPDGMISLVLAGDIPAAGRTPMQLGMDISARLKKYIQDPSVSVVVTGVNSQRIFVIGEIGKVGPLMLSPGMTPLQAISSAGGLSPFASPKHIYILRGAQGKQVKIPFNYKLALKGDSKQLITLLPGDTIVVP